jgi:thioredoxin 1
MTFLSLIQSERPVLVDFYATWCGPCKAMKPILETVKSELGEQISVFKIDVDRNQALSQELGIQSIPTLILYKDGKPVWRKSGVASATEIQSVVAAYLAAP